MDSGAPVQLAPTGRLRAAINLGNPVMAQGTPDNPRGVTVDLARHIAAALGVPVAFECVDAAKDSFGLLVDGRVDIAFVAIETARAEKVAFTVPYKFIEGVFAVRAQSPLLSPGDVDREGVRIGVKEGSAYDLYLTRTLQHAQLVRGPEGVDVFERDGLEAGAGVREPTTEWVASHPGTRLIGEAFMEIRQAVAVPRAVDPRRSHGSTASSRSSRAVDVTSAQEQAVLDVLRDVLAPTLLASMCTGRRSWPGCGRPAIWT